MASNIIGNNCFSNMIITVIIMNVFLSVVIIVLVLLLFFIHHLFFLMSKVVRINYYSQLTTVYLWCDGHSTSNSACGGVGGKGRDSSIQEEASHTYT